MPSHHLSIIALSSLITLLVFSGCSPIAQNQSRLDSTDNTERPAVNTEPDPELQPLEAESEICLHQELEALKLTGDWSSPAEASLPQTVVDSFVQPRVTYDFPVTTNKQVEVYLKLFQGQQRTYFRRWLERSGAYLPMIQQELAAAGLPLDLAYLSMIESGFNQRAYSRSRAVGLWQFMRGTGRDYQLRIDRYVDERRDALKSTKAAVSYLKNLYREFNDWYLAVAAYNAGPGTIRKAIKRTKTKDFWKIAQNRSLKLETKRYVPKLIAAIIIAKEPEKYGFFNIAYKEPLAFDTITVGPGLDLNAAALLTGSSRDRIKALNAELRTGKTPLNREQYELKIPAGTRALALATMPRLHSVVSTDYKTHIVRKGETLAKICKRYKINTTTILKVNNLVSAQLRNGTRLRIPFRTVHYHILPKGVNASVAARDSLVLHTIKKGDTISKISKQYQVPVELIVSWNGLHSIHRITAGDQLALYLSSGSGKTSAPPAPTVSAPSGNDNLVVLSRNAKWAPAEKMESADNHYYLVKTGDSLWTISRRFNISPAEIKKWNNLKSNLIHPGSRLRLRDV
ncbi:MAG: lytic transglycosylase [Proteobacteria bacterium]|nr:MAG: lytic transglycosylase [Pseudomonadota bacterium]PIE64969.1 MAG: lytic transglycosylase [Desulfobacterales bacterium]